MWGGHSGLRCFDLFWISHRLVCLSMLLTSFEACLDALVLQPEDYNVSDRIIGFFSTSCSTPSNFHNSLMIINPFMYFFCPDIPNALWFLINSIIVLFWHGHPMINNVYIGRENQNLHPWKMNKCDKNRSLVTESWSFHPVHKAKNALMQKCNLNILNIFYVVSQLYTEWVL